LGREEVQLLLYPFLTSALEGGEWSASRPGRPSPPVPSMHEAGQVLEPVWTQRLDETSSASAGYRTPAVQSVTRHYTDCYQALRKVRNDYTNIRATKKKCSGGGGGAMSAAATHSHFNGRFRKSAPSQGDVTALQGLHKTRLSSRGPYVGKPRKGRQVTKIILPHLQVCTLTISGGATSFGRARKNATASFQCSLPLSRHNEKA
jgi:hypothetical protein